MSDLRRPSRAMVLAAGLGTRLRPITDERPKPLVEVLGTTLLEYAMQNAVRAGARVIALNTHHLPDLVAREAQRIGRALSVEVNVSHEPVILGTGGGIKKMRTLLPDDDGPILVANADALIDLDVESLIATHARHRPISTLVLKETADQEKYGVIGTDETGRVRDFVGRVPVIGSVVKKGMFCGVHLLEEEVLDALTFEREMCINKEAYPRLLVEDRPVHAFFHDGEFWDVGTAARLIDANLSLLDGRARFRFLDAGGAAPATSARRIHTGAQHAGAVLREPVLLAEGAFVDEGATVGPGVVVGRGVKIGKRAQVTHSVLLEGARVFDDEVLTNTVVGTAVRAGA
jgi:mannose-1-phosphate guanylyltransferase